MPAIFHPAPPIPPSSKARYRHQVNEIPQAKRDGIHPSSSIISLDRKHPFETNYYFIGRLAWVGKKKSWQYSLWK